MRTRTFAVLISTVVVSAAIAALLWFFSNPAGLTRQEATSHLVTFAVQTLTLSAVAGFAAMATLEMLKRLLHLRGRFFLGRVAGLEFLRPDRPDRPDELDEPDELEAEAKLDYRAGVRRFDLPLEQLMAQLGYATDRALDELFPSRVEPESRRGRARRPAEPPPKWREYVRDRAWRGRDYVLLVKLLGEASISQARAQDDPTKLRVETQAALDDLQVKVGNAWRWRLRLASCVLAALFALAALIYVPVPPGSKIAALAGSFLLGGFFAGFFRDLVALVERLRRL